MVEELSALDAELDRLGVEPAADSTALAVSYAGPLGGLSDVDAALSALSAGLDSSLVRGGTAPFDASALGVPRALSTPPPPPLRSAMPPEPPRPPENRLPESLRPAELTRPADPDSAEIELPEPARDLAEHSGELPLDAVEVGTTESGAFALPPDEPVTEDVSFVEDLEELIEVEPHSQVLDDHPGRISEADRLVDAEFAELFSEASGEPPSVYGEDDTEIFDSGAIAAIKAKGELEPIENAFNAEELDSAEFEIVMDSANDDRPHESSTSSIPNASSPSTPPEKRPSFLGRLFGRKDE